jgi:pimeloyl-ACP methyl ester carboxylesterase
MEVLMIVGAHRRRVLFGATAVAGLLLASTWVATSPASAKPTASRGAVTQQSSGRVELTQTGTRDQQWRQAKPTVVLVHGAWADSSSWNGVIEQLHRAGYPVVAAANPLAGLDQDSATVASLLRSIKGPIVLVGHSYGGAVITNAAAGNPNVKALVFIAAFAPDQGETIGGLISRPVAHPVAMLPLLSYPTVNADGTTDTEFYLDPAQFRDVFAGVVNPTLAADMAVTQRPVASGAIADATHEAAWHTVPSWYLVAKQDHAIAPDLERFMAQRAHAQTIEVNGSHSVMISHPDTVAHLIENAAWSTQ